MAERLEGGCLCGAIRYEITGGLGPIGHCHCRTCRKGQGAAFATTARARWDAFFWTSGESLLRSYESTPGKQRAFCETCGSKLLAYWEGEPSLILRLGSLDTDPGGRPVVHVWTEQSADWDEIGPALPALPRGTPPRES